MKSQNILRNFKFFIFWFFSLALIFIYLFLIVWTYCYSLFVYYLLAAAFLAAIAIYCVNRSKMQAVKFLILGLFLFCVLSPFNLKQYNRRAEALQNKINDQFELNTREKLGIYGCLLMVMAFEIIPFPEAAIQNYYLLSPSKNGERIFYDQDILNSPSVQRAVKLGVKGKIYWSRWNFIHNKDFRYAMAFDPCTVKTEEKDGRKQVILSTDFGYRENFVTHHATQALRGIFAFRVDEGLFWYLQERGWLHPYKAIWIANL